MIKTQLTASTVFISYCVMKQTFILTLSVLIGRMINKFKYITELVTRKQDNIIEYYQFETSKVSWDGYSKQ